MKAKRSIMILMAVLAAVFSVGTVFASGQDEEKENTPAPVALQIVGPWSASEADAFEVVLDDFRKRTSIEVVYEASQDIIKMLGPRIAAGETPDLAILPVGKGLKEFAAQGAVISLNDMKSEIEANFDASWLNQFTVDGEILAVPIRANIDTLLWYNPEVVTELPATWKEFLVYSDRIAANGGKVTAGIGKDSWTLTLLFEAVYLSSFGVDKYNALMNGDIPWNDASVTEALSRIATFYGDKYAAGGSAGALGTGLVDGIARVFGTNADAQFVAAGSWVAEIVQGAVNKDIVEGKTIDYIPFPGDGAGDGCIIAAADVAIILADSPNARKLLSHLMSVEAQSLFAPNGYTVANKNIDPGIYSGLAAKTAELLANSKVGPTTGVVMTSEHRDYLVEVMQAAILDPSSITSLVEELEATIGNH